MLSIAKKSLGVLLASGAVNVAMAQPVASTKAPVVESIPLPGIPEYMPAPAKAKKLETKVATPEPAAMPTPTATPIVPVVQAPTRVVISEEIIPAGPRVWGGFEYLNYSFRPGRTPPLATTSNNVDLGIIGRPSTEVIFGGDYGTGRHSGYKAIVGGWLNEASTFGLEVSFTYFQPRNLNQLDVTTDPSRTLGVPFNNVAAAGLTGGLFGRVNPVPGEDAVRIGGSPPSLVFPSTGRIVIDSSTQMWGTELNAILGSAGTGAFRVNGIFGLRYQELGESLNMSYLSTPNTALIALPGLAPTLVDFANDNFSTRNQFFGGQVGAKAQWNGQRFFASTTAKVAMGVNHQTVDINGNHFDSNILGGVGVPNAGPDGIFATSTNSGHYQFNRFSVIPEVNMTAGVNVTSRLKLSVGYDYLYWTNVARPGDQIDRNINVTFLHQFPGFVFPAPSGTPAPVFSETQSNFWAHGVNFGIQYAY